MGNVIGCTLWLFNIDPENGQFYWKRIFRALIHGRVYVNLGEGNSIQIGRTESSFIQLSHILYNSNGIASRYSEI